MTIDPMSAMRRPITSISARACSSVTPGFSLPIAPNQWKLRVMFAGSNASGFKICAGLRSNMPPLASTPTTVYA